MTIAPTQPMPRPRRRKLRRVLAIIAGLVAALLLYCGVVWIIVVVQWKQDRAATQLVRADDLSVTRAPTGPEWEWPVELMHGEYFMRRTVAVSFSYRLLLTQGVSNTRAFVVTRKVVRHLNGLAQLRAVASQIPIKNASLLIQHLRAPGHMQDLVFQSPAVVSPSVFPRLGQFTKIRVLIADVPGLTNKQASGLASLRRLRMLLLSHTNLHGVAVRAIAALPHLHDLTLDEDAAFTDADARRLAASRTVRNLMLGGDKQLNNAALRSFGHMTRLRTLTISRGNITAAARFPPMPRLANLFIGRTEAGNATVRSLGHEPRLRCLLINHTAVGNAALPALERLKHLTFLLAHHTKITPAAATRLINIVPSLLFVQLTNWTARRRVVGGPVMINKTHPKPRKLLSLKMRTTNVSHPKTAPPVPRLPPIHGPGHHE